MSYSPPSLKVRAGLGLVAALSLLGLTILSSGGSIAIARPAPDDPASETITLFNGKDLEGWEGHEKYWSVVNGVIVGKSTEKVPVSTYLLTRKKFTDFRLTAKVKLVKNSYKPTHSGISLWGKLAPEKGDPYTYMGHLVMFPLGWGMHDLYRRNGLKEVDPKPAQAAAKGRDFEWNDLEILATGLNIKVAVNGVAVVDYTEKTKEFKAEGPIGLQLHSNNFPQEVQFKDLVIETFPRDASLKTLKKP